jgi:hypothetical protein
MSNIQRRIDELKSKQKLREKQRATATSDVERKRGALSTADREYVLGVHDGTPQAKSKRRSAIQTRLTNAVKDFAMLAEAWDACDADPPAVDEQEVREAIEFLKRFD